MKLATYLDEAEWQDYSKASVYKGTGNIKYLNSYLLRELDKVLMYNTGMSGKVIAFTNSNVSENKSLELLEKSPDCHRVELEYPDDLCSFFRKSKLQEVSQILDRVDTKYYDLFMEELYFSREPINADDVIVLTPLLFGSKSRDKTKNMEVTDR